MFKAQIGDGEELRLLEVHDAEALFELVSRNRERLREWVPWLHRAATIELTREFIGHHLQRFAAGNGFSAGIWLQGKLAGQIALEYVDRDNLATEVGYWIDAAAEGKGLVTRACQGVIDHAFGELALNRVQIRCATANARSRTIAERLGFAHEGVLRQVERLEDRFVDLAIYGMLRSEWLALQTAAAVPKNTSQEAQVLVAEPDGQPLL